MIGDLITNNRFEVSMKSPEEKKSMNVGFFSDNATETNIKSFFNNLCDVEIHKIKKCSVYKLTEIQGVISQADFRDVSLTIKYKFNGDNIATNKFYLPRVPKSVQFDTIVSEVRKLFGQDAQIIKAAGI